MGKPTQWLRAGLGLSALLAGMAMAQAQSANVVQENFTGDKPNNNWIALGGACLTAGDDKTVVSGGIGIPACIGDSFYQAWPAGASTAPAGYNPTNSNDQTPLVGLPYNTAGTAQVADTLGSGALRLTNGGYQGVNEAGAIISTTPFSASQGIQITFTTYTYGGNAYQASNKTKPGADGIGFYLIDASQYASGSAYLSNGYFGPGDLGAFGGSLGYSCSNGNYPYNGMIGGYIGLGIDEYGNFFNYNDNTHTGQTAVSTNAGKQNPGEIGLRGAGNVNWAWLNANYPKYYPSSLNTPYDSQGHTYAALAVQATCKSGTLWNYSSPTQTCTWDDNGNRTCSGGPVNTGTAIADYHVIQPGSVVTLPSTQPISSQESNSQNASANRGAAKPITYKVIVTSTGLLSFYYDYGNATLPDGSLNFKQVLNQVDISTSNGTPPSSYLFGFGGSTGGGTNVHEITCFEATPAARTIGSPVAPLTVSSGSLLYTLTSNPSPVQGYVNAYSLDASGNPSTTTSWEAGAEMSDSLRSGGLYSTSSDGKTVTKLSALDSAAFNLSASTCVPDTSTIVNYTVDANASYSSTPSGCTAAYLGSRAVGSLLDEFSPGDDAVLLNPPNAATLLTQPGYATFAQTESKRKPALLFTNDDGFLYSVDASTGAMNWGWMPRAFVGNLQNYTTFPYQDNFAGKLVVTDAYDSSVTPAAWGTYVLGSANGGRLWYDLKLLDSSSSSSSDVPAPSQVIATFGPYQSTMPANTTALPNATSVSYPQRQAPVVANVNGTQYAAFLVNAATTTGSGSSATTTTVSYLYEFNIATGASTSQAIPASAIGSSGQYVTSNLFYDAGSNVLYFGTSDGKVYSMSFSGSASTDVGNIGKLGATEDGQPVQYVGYQQLKNQPYLWAASSSVITVFGINNLGWSPLWATGPNVAYSYTSSGGTAAWNTLTSSTSPSPLQANATISDLPLVVNGVLVVPVYVPPSATAQACNIAGEGYYDFFSLASGAFPLNSITQNGKTLTADIDLGQGKAYSPSVSISGTALPLYGSTQQTQTPQSPLLFGRSGLNTIVQWRIH